MSPPLCFHQHTFGQHRILGCEIPLRFHRFESLLQEYCNYSIYLKDPWYAVALEADLDQRCYNLNYPRLNGTDLDHLTTFCQTLFVKRKLFRFINVQQKGRVIKKLVDCRCKSLLHNQFWRFFILLIYTHKFYKYFKFLIIPLHINKSKMHFHM